MKSDAIHYAGTTRIWIVVAIAATWLAVWAAWGESASTPHQSSPPDEPMALVRAVMCETIDNYEAKNVAAVFSIGVGKISCFTSFANIKNSSVTLHKWFRRDDLVTTKRLSLKPPSWSTYSSIQLREADKGPWRVEILDGNDQIVQTVRFSVTD